MRGVLFIDYVKMLRRHKVAERAGRHLGLEDAHFLLEKLQPDAWYPMATFERLGLAILHEIVGTETDSIRLWGRSQLAGLLKFFPELAAAGDPRDAIMRLHTLLRSLFDFECVTLESVDDESAFVGVDYGMSPQAESAATWQTMGFFEELITHSGGAGVAGELATGGFSVTWGQGPKPELPRRLKVLVVDDEPLVRGALVRLLERDTDVAAAATPAEALEKLQRDAFDAVLADFDLESEVDGLALLAQIAARWPQLTRVLHTGLLVPEVERQVRLGAVHAVVTKPAPLDVLLRALGQGR